tara:strand:+ start:2585 stop:3202 length:618 start_codon:yes stop_codon:yes gene_type:complete
MELTIKEIYNKIGKQFNNNRVRVWPLVRQYLDNMNVNTRILDIGCGNGKNMFYRKDLDFYGIDFCDVLLEIVNDNGGKVKYGLLQNIPHNDESFDNFICIAAYHHLDNIQDRKKSLNEMYRILKPGGTGLLSVWAMEQEEGSPFHFTKEDEMVKWKCRTDGNTYYRYYHIYRKEQLAKEIKELEPHFNIEIVDYDKGNWFIILKK